MEPFVTGEESMIEEESIQNQINELDAELHRIDQGLQRAINIASRNIWVKQGQPIAGLREFHDAPTKRSDDILDKIKELRAQLAKIEPTR
jgi:hypothetical protein